MFGRNSACFSPAFSRCNFASDFENMAQFNRKQMGAHEHAAAQKKERSFGSSAMRDLYNYLNPDQKEFIKPILAVLNEEAQIMLCTALLDYLETGKPSVPENVMLGGCFYYLTNCNDTHVREVLDNKILRPLRIDKNV